MNEVPQKPQGLHRMNDHTAALMILSIFLLFFSLPLGFAAVPVISAFTSDTNGSSQYIQLNSGTVITFSVTAANATSYNWYVDTHLNATQHTSTLVMSMSGYHSIGVSAQNANGNSSRQYKTIVVNQVTATQPITPLNDSNYWTFEDLLANPDFLTVLQFVPSPYTYFIGNVFYLIIWFLLFSMIWIRSDKITVVTTLGFIIGGFVIGTLPAQYQLISQVIIVSGLFAAIYIFSKERR